MRFGRTLARFAAFLFVLAGLPAVGLADQPVEWGIGLQEAASPVMERMHDFYDLLYIVIMLIAVFVTLLLAYVMIRFRASRNPVPSKTSHNTPLEIAWTVIPVFILLLIAIPAFRLLYFQDRIQDADMTLKVVGHQWYWSYEYPDQGGFTFDSIMLAADELEPGQPRLLSVDEKVVLPVDTNIRILMTADDVLHAWAVPALGVKTDTV
ncbi:MAG: cytochrome c oxidase subunit II, partial [Alphaproteobacteria bacterium]|nr:cytochrome c oxidase subunit II [Alphaproteobacteria bacterium]